MKELLVCLVGVVASALVVLAPVSASTSSPPWLSHDITANCTTGLCEDLDDDEPRCPPDSAPDLTIPDSPCVCTPSHCVQTVCRHGMHRVLKRRGSSVPGDCCDIYECVMPKEKNCSNVVCPKDQLKCPSDSFQLPGHRAPHDCCSMPQGCQCMPRACAPANCTQGQVMRMVREGDSKPGSCCPLYECVVEHKLNDTCEYEGHFIQNGTSVWKDSCHECNCRNGLLFCSSSPPCPKIPPTCSATEIRKGECCPVCVSDPPGGCMTASGQIKLNGQEWMEDPCTTCTCLEGHRKCSASMCEVSCPNPRDVPGECCPVCDVECTLDCPLGFLHDNQDHKLCQCVPDECPPLIDCTKNCSHGFRVNKAGCEMCRCNQCRFLNCNKTCLYGFRINDRGCHICKCQASPVQSSDPSTPVTMAVCKTTDGEIHEDGETWFDGCRQCYCHGSTEMCNLITCPIPSCNEPTFNSSSSCCPQCPDEPVEVTAEHHTMVCHSIDGVYRVEGETWQLDSCTHCLCHSGRVLCETRECPPTPCEHPSKQAGHCCTECPLRGLPEVEQPRSCSAHRPHGATWREKNCRSCLCQDGEAHCFTEKCPSLFCDRPVLEKNQCCSICLDQSAPMTCSTGNVTYQAGEEWLEDSCVRCTCVDGQRTCAPKACPVTCSNPVKSPDQCCPVCPGSPEGSSTGLLEERTYLVIIAVLFVSLMCLVVYLLWQCHRNRQRKLEMSPKSCPNPAYNGYTHRDSFPPPRYTSTDRQAKCEPYHYKYVPSYDSQQFDLLKSPSFGVTEKTALAV